MYSKEDLQRKYEIAVNLGLSGAELLKDPREIEESFYP